jgi:outer membrane protein assembly factor BamB
VIVADVAGKPQLIVFAGSGLHGMDPANGKTLWQQPWKSQDDITASTPVYDGKGNLFISTGDALGKAGMFQLSATEAKKLWEKRDYRTKFSAPILEGNTLYIVTEEGRGWIKSMSWPDGKVNYEMRKPALGFGGSILRVGGDKLIAQAQTGEVYLIQATPKAGKIISTFTPFEEAKEVWSNPVVYQGKLFLKGPEELVCYEVK